MKFELSDPVVVALSEPNETRWGFHQFPALSVLPDGKILIMFADAEDDLVKLKKMMRDMQKKLETHQIMSPKKISGEI